MDTGLKKLSNRSSAIAEHLLNDSDCAKSYSDCHFSIISKVRNDYPLSVLESLFIQTFKPNLCKQQYVYKFNFYKLSYLLFVAYFIIHIGCFVLYLYVCLSYLN